MEVTIRDLAPTSAAGSVHALYVLERVCSIPALLGSLFVISTFCTIPGFRKPINRLIFYASFGNIMSNVGLLLADSFLHAPTSAGCQFQALLFQWFLPADAYWALAMALNVYLTFYCKYDAQKLRKMEIIYLVCCYVLPFIPALTFIFISDPERGRFYGAARLWCWATPKWRVAGVATLYAPVWAAIVIIFAIYIRTGNEILRIRRSLHYLSNRALDESLPDGNAPSFAKTTEVVIPSEEADSWPNDGQNGAVRPPSERLYSEPISAGVGREEAYQQKDDEPSTQNRVVQPTVLEAQRAEQGNNVRIRRAVYESNTAAWSYAKYTLFFFTALLVTWVPPTCNRIASTARLF
ncbi:G-PROTEIN-RECEP-F2-4 domain-containing protein [Fusarium falciforme]|uniref:G-PROTEIN-RECEP-F2-4 domain-containing protein n=1 Tax=Fusarium falciforme TaxID=195108 RepID=UPI0023001471|nr:G-PROTEIN-RECEP-F2-4 domain-containing protein [Fusarium falciforme]WAO93525.1 G-PROTEIN-RECEP-F2-4 domain-containing protein [Fusarium falciforme]